MGRRFAHLDAPMHMRPPVKRVKLAGAWDNVTSLLVSSCSCRGSSCCAWLCPSCREAAGMMLVVIGGPCTATTGYRPMLGQQLLGLRLLRSALTLKDAGTMLCGVLVGAAGMRLVVGAPAQP